MNNCVDYQLLSDHLAAHRIVMHSMQKDVMRMEASQLLCPTHLAHVFSWYARTMLLLHTACLHFQL